MDLLISNFMADQRSLHGAMEQISHVSGLRIACASSLHAACRIPYKLHTILLHKSLI